MFPDVNGIVSSVEIFYDFLIQNIREIRVQQN
jgi:hypothetical protein